MKRLITKTAKRWTVGMMAGLWVTAASAQITTDYNFTFHPNRIVPDGSFSGLAMTTNLTGMSGIITNLTMSLNISGGYNGDLYAYLRGPNGGFATLLNRVGVTDGDAFGYSESGFNITFDDSSSYADIHFYQNLSYTLDESGQLTGLWSSDGRAVDPLSAPSVFTETRPTSRLNSFAGLDPNGTWTLFLSDLSNGEQSTAVSWSLNIATVPEPSTWVLLGFGVVIFLGTGSHKKIPSFAKLSKKRFLRAKRLGQRV